jgi:hypothetical protein
MVSLRHLEMRCRNGPSERTGAGRQNHQIGVTMAELEGKPVSLEELMVSTLAMTDALTKLLIEKGVITDAEFKQELLEERAVYKRILNPTTQ